MAIHQECERIFRAARRQAWNSLRARRAGLAFLRPEVRSTGPWGCSDKEAEAICREMEDVRGLATALGNQAIFLKKKGDLDGALALQKEVEAIHRKSGASDGLQISLGDQALILEARGDLAGALALHKEKARICRESGNKKSLAVALEGQAGILWARRDFDGALALMREQERIGREIADPECVAVALMNQASLILLPQGLAGEALSLAETAYDIAVRSGLSNYRRG